MVSTGVGAGLLGDSITGGSDRDGGAPPGLLAAGEDVGGETSNGGPGTATTRTLDGAGLCTRAGGERGVAGEETTVGIGVTTGAGTATCTGVETGAGAGGGAGAAT